MSLKSLIARLAAALTGDRRSRPVTGPLVGKKGRPAPGSPDTENPYDALFS